MALDENEAIPDRGKISLRLVDLLRYQLPFGHAPVMPEDGCLIVKTEVVSDWPGSSMKIKDPPSRDGWRFTSPALRSPANYVASRSVQPRRGPPLLEASHELAQPCGDLFEAADVPLPAIVCALVVGLVFGPEARLLHAHENAAPGRDQCPGDDGLQPSRCLFA